MDYSAGFSSEDKIYNTGFPPQENRLQDSVLNNQPVKVLLGENE